MRSKIWCNVCLVPAPTENLYFKEHFVTCFLTHYDYSRFGFYQSGTLYPDRLQHIRNDMCHKRLPDVEELIIDCHEEFVRITVVKEGVITSAKSFTLMQFIEYISLNYYKLGDIS